MDELRIAPGTTLKVIPRDDDVLEFEAHYAGEGSPPPPHLHPAQDERFEVVEGEMNTKIAGEEGTLAQGDVIEIARGTPHQMWNSASEPALLRWETTPAGRTLDWFREIAALQG